MGAEDLKGRFIGRVEITTNRVIAQPELGGAGSGVPPVITAIGYSDEQGPIGDGRIDNTFETAVGRLLEDTQGAVLYPEGVAGRLIRSVFDSSNS